MALATYKEDNLCCPICTDELKQPKSLPCCHGFCKDCLHTYILSKPVVNVNRVAGFNCPICRTFTAAPNQRAPRHQWASGFLTDFRFVSMLDSLPDDTTESPVSSPASCTCHRGPVEMFCQTHVCDICKTCALNTHSKCKTISKDKVTSEFGKVLNQLQRLVQTLEKVKIDLERSADKTDIKVFKRVVARDRQLKDSKIKNDILTTIDGIMDSHHLNLDKRKSACQLIMHDARHQLTMARSLGNQSTDQLCTSVDVLQVALKDLEDRHQCLTRLANPLDGIKRRASAYLSFAVSPLKQTDSSIEFEKKGSNVPNSFFLRLHESFNAKIPSDSRNCLITGAVILADGRVVLADTNNSNIKLFSSGFAFVNFIDLLAPPFDVAETECSHIAVTFGKRNVIHFYEVNDKLPHEHKSMSTDQPCYGISSGNGLLHVYCGNSWFSPACIKIYDYQHTLITKIFMDMFSRGEYLGYCPVSEYSYVTSQKAFKFAPRQLHCYSGDGDRRTLRLVYRDLRSASDLIRGMVGLNHGVIMVAQNSLESSGLMCFRSTIIFGDNRLLNDNMYTEVLLGTNDAQFARIVASNKQRTLLLIGQEAPFFMDKRNNQVKIFHIASR